jgi:hypothetical protein
VRRDGFSLCFKLSIANRTRQLPRELISLILTRWSTNRISNSTLEDSRGLE